MEQGSMKTAVSTDVVLDIVLSHLETRDLLSCRKVSKFWNKAASSVFRKHSTMTKIVIEENQLMELGDSIERNSEFPFAGLRLDDPRKLNSPRAIEFFNSHGDKFTSLYLGISLETRIQDIAPVVNHLPHLSCLEVRGTQAYHPPANNDQLLFFAAGQEDGPILKLPSLRIFRISSELNEDVLRQVCTAASPSLRIECLNPRYICDILGALKRLGKLQDVSVFKSYAELDGNDHTVMLAELLSPKSPTLTKLEMGIGSFLLMKLLTSSQQTLKHMRLYGTYPSQFSTECPVLPKLTTLSLCIVDQSYKYVFKGSQGHKFPALKKLKLDTPKLGQQHSIRSLSGGLFIVPSLTMIHLNAHVEKTGFEDLARSFPNVIEIRVEYRYDEADPSDIWSVGAFKFLEKLRIWEYPVERPTKNYINMDSFLTGIPVVICENLRKSMQVHLNDSPFNEILRSNPSILQLKNLKQLTVCVDISHELEDLPEEPPFMSMVSLWYALQMMPNLEARFVYEGVLPPWHFGRNNRDRFQTALKAAFKHVHPHVKLEPFFY